MKGNRLTVFILVAMVLGVLVGYLMNQFGTGNGITYSPNKDYTGSDTISFNISGQKVDQKIFVVKDSAAYKRVRDSIESSTWLVVSNSSKKYTPSVLQQDDLKLKSISNSPRHGIAVISAIQSFSDNIKLLTTMFLRLVQMIIAPLVFTTLVVGIAKLGDLKSVGRVGGKAMLWFVSASLVSLLLGLVLVNFFHPGTVIEMNNADMAGAKDLVSKTQEFSLAKFVEHVFPKSFIEAMATNEILQIVIFSIFFGVAMSALGDITKPVVKALDAVAHV